MESSAFGKEEPLSERMSYQRLEEAALTPWPALKRGIVTRIPMAVCQVLGFREGDLAGHGLGVINSELVGVCSLYVAPTARRSGLGKAMLRRIFRWAEMRGSGRAYLQVEANNGPALRLHQGMGLTESYPAGIASMGTIDRVVRTCIDVALVSS